MVSVSARLELFLETNVFKNVPFFMEILPVFVLNVMIIVLVVMDLHKIAQNA